MLSPKKVKFRKQHRNVNTRLLRKATRGTKISFGDFALVALEPKWVTARQIEAARIAMTRHIKRGGKVWIRIFPDMPYTKKPAETRMGKGKGNPESWVACVRPGMVMFEIAGVDPKLAERAIELAGAKLPIKTRFAVRKDLETTNA